MQMDVHGSLNPFYTATPQRICPMLRQQSEKMRFIVNHSQIYCNNYQNRLSADFQSKVLIFTEVLPWSLTKPQFMTLFYQAIRAGNVWDPIQSDQSPFP